MLTIQTMVTFNRVTKYIQRLVNHEKKVLTGSLS